MLGFGVVVTVVGGVVSFSVEYVVVVGEVWFGRGVWVLVSWWAGVVVSCWNAVSVAVSLATTGVECC